MRTVHTEPTPVTMLRDGDLVDLGDGKLLPVSGQWVDGVIRVGPLMLYRLRSERLDLVVSDHSETSLFAPDGALF